MIRTSRTAPPISGQRIRRSHPRAGGAGWANSSAKACSGVSASMGDSAESAGLIKPFPEATAAVLVREYARTVGGASRPSQPQRRNPRKRRLAPLFYGLAEHEPN